MNLVASPTRIGTGTLKDIERTAAVRQKTNWRITVGRASCALDECRNCRYCQLQGNAGVRFSSMQTVCLLTSAPTKKRATCALFSPGPSRLYVEECIA